MAGGVSVTAIGIEKIRPTRTEWAFFIFGQFIFVGDFQDSGEVL